MHTSMIDVSTALEYREQPMSALAKSFGKLIVMFGIAIIFMCILGAVFNGSNVLLPQFLQGLMGYTATAAGFALSPSGFGVAVQR